jgi:hypothetical protein
MRKLIVIFLLVITTIQAQEFKYSGFIYNAAEIGIQNVPVKLYGKRTSIYSITQPTYTAYTYNAGTVVPSSDDVTHVPTLLLRRACRGHGCCANNGRCAAGVGTTRTVAALSIP